MGRQYTHVQAVEKEMLEMKAAGKTNREIAEHFGFKDKYVVKEWVKRYNRKKRKMEAGIVQMCIRDRRGTDKRNQAGRTGKNADLGKLHPHHGGKPADDQRGRRRGAEPRDR